MDIAGPGDTVLVYPGNYTDRGRRRQLVQGELCDVLAVIWHDRVVLRGTERDRVEIGPVSTTYPPSGLGAATIGVLTATGTSGVRIENLTVLAQREGIRTQGPATISNVVVEYCRHGVYGNHTSDLSLENSSLQRNAEAVWVTASSGLHVTNCEISGPGNGVTNYWSSPNARIESCRFRDLDLALHVRRLSDAEVLRCDFERCDSGIVVRESATATLTHNRVRNGGISLHVQLGCHAEGSGNAFHAGLSTTLLFDQGATARLTGNHILLWSPRSVELRLYDSLPEPVHLDLRGNYWGTSDRELVAARIWDGNDDPVQQGFVDFEPIAETPLPAEVRSFGDLKAAFRQR